MGGKSNAETQAMEMDMMLDNVKRVGAAYNGAEYTPKYAPGPNDVGMHGGNNSTLPYIPDDKTSLTGMGAILSGAFSNYVMPLAVAHGQQNKSKVTGGGGGGSGNSGSGQTFSGGTV